MKIKVVTRAGMSSDTGILLKYEYGDRYTLPILYLLSSILIGDVMSPVIINGN